jgi:hypothetical protein
MANHEENTRLVIDLDTTRADAKLLAWEARAN